jgi:hypothetical protein
MFEIVFDISGGFRDAWSSFMQQLLRGELL